MDQPTVTANMREMAGRRDALEALLRRRLSRDPLIAGFAGGRTMAGAAGQDEPSLARASVSRDLMGLLGRSGV
jgi:hypothetical protein